MALSLVWTLNAHAQSHCSHHLEIPRVAKNSIQAEPGLASLRKYSEAHRRVGPIFKYRMVPRPLMLAVPLARLAAKIPGRWRGPLNDLVAMTRDLSGEIVHVASPDLIEAIARQPLAFGREYDRMALDKTIGRSGLLLLEDDEGEGERDRAWTEAHQAMAPALTQRHVRAAYADILSKNIDLTLEHHGASAGALESTAFAERLPARVMYEILFDRPLPDWLFERLSAHASAVWSGRRPAGHDRTEYRNILEGHVREIAPTLTTGLARELRERAPASVPDWWMDQLTTLMFAATDTTRAALSWTLWELARHPEWQARLRGPDGPADARLFVKEALRLHTTVGILARVARAPVKIGPYRLNKGDLVLMGFHELHQMAFQDPARFDPDRFRAPDLPSFAHCPFGYGRRVCLGQHLAYAEMEAVILTLARRFDVTADREEVGTDRTRGGPMAADLSLRLILTPR